MSADRHRQRSGRFRNTRSFYWNSVTSISFTKNSSKQEIKMFYVKGNLFYSISALIERD